MNTPLQTRTSKFKAFASASPLVLAALGVLALTQATHVAWAQTSTVIKVVAAENFYGNVAQQLGGNHVSVTSLISDPNADPHEYESSVQDGVAIAEANVVIENGFDYDDWIDTMLSASPNANRILLTGAKIATYPLPDNPHLWYDPRNMDAVAQAIVAAFKKVDPADASDFDANLASFEKSLTPIEDKMKEIKSKYAGTPVGLTETIYLYQSEQMGLNVLTPFDFEKAIAEGNDPSVQSVQMANDQITNKQIKILIFNDQTITPITTNMQNEAKALNIPIVPVWETMPPGKTYQTWMLNQLNNLEQALQSTAHD